MKINKKIIAVALVTLGLLGFFSAMGEKPPVDPASVSFTTLQKRSLSETFIATGTIKPRNRLEILPPTAGRVEKILVREGQNVKAGEVLALMSSTDRATLIDAAHGQGEEAANYWQEVYKPISLVSPMDATVIVATLRPGQVVSVTTPIVVLSDELIAQAQVDEIDVGRTRVGQKATIVLDAFQEVPISALVEHVYYESVIDSNVNVYRVDIKPESSPDFFRSGMNAQITFEVAQKEDAWALPASDVTFEGAQASVKVMSAKGKEEIRPIQTGLKTDQWVEVLGGLTPEEKVVSSLSKLNLQIKEQGKNPFMPQFQRRQK